MLASPAMVTSDRSCRVESRDGDRTLVLEGVWRLADLRALAAELDRLGAELAGVAALDGAALQAIDTAGALLVWSRLRAGGADAATLALRGFVPAHQRIVTLVRERLEATEDGDAHRRPGPFARAGHAAVDFVGTLHGHVALLGLTVVEIGRAILRPGLVRWRELATQLAQTGVSAIPVVILVTFLIGVVFAYLLGLQATQYGANIFVVDGVALGMTREFSPLIVATIVAGRSGAAFTAQLGTMKLTEEIDAIRTLGLSAEQVLVLPRVLALVVTLPLLVFVGDLAGLAGAMLIAAGMLDVTPQTFIERLHVALDPRHYLIGLGKAPVFALFIAVIGCRMGIAVARDTRSIGINTTSTVVQSIVVVILLDAVFAVLFQRIGW